VLMERGTESPSKPIVKGVTCEKMMTIFSDKLGQVQRWGGSLGGGLERLGLICRRKGMSRKTSSQKEILEMKPTK